MYYCYIIRNSNCRVYNGYTSDLARRIRQHNSLIKGGAKSTRGQYWEYVAWIEVLDRGLAMSYEAKIRKGRGIEGRILKMKELSEDIWLHSEYKLFAI